LKAALRQWATYDLVHSAQTSANRAQKLGTQIEQARAESGQPVCVIGYSPGGLIARHAKLTLRRGRLAASV
jgi:hypothetical protein